MKSLNGIVFIIFILICIYCKRIPCEDFFQERGEERQKLYDYIKKNRPNLHNEIGSIKLSEVYIVLNRETGFNFKRTDLVEPCCSNYLVAFTKQDEETIEGIKK